MNITIVGIAHDGKISQEVLQAAKKASAVVLQTGDIKTSALDDAHIKYDTLDKIYEGAANFDNLLNKACDFLMRDNLLYIVVGDIYFNEIAREVSRRINRTSDNITVIPGGDAALCMAVEHGILDKVTGVQIYNASSFTRIYDTDNVLVINEIDSQLIASELKSKLLKHYTAEHTVFLSDTRGLKGESIPLYTLDGAPFYGYYMSIVVPPCSFTKKKRYAYSDLVRVMDTLRSINGCPWDKEQTHKSLKRYLIEESYEVLEAIDCGDTNALFDELGDVLLQVVFHAKIAQQHGEFDDTDITSAICNKMISRHTHIFGSGSADTSADVINNWEQIKKDEKGQQTQTDVLRHVPKSMPALMRSEKVQHKAAHVGFDFHHLSEAISKLREEIDEFEQDIQNNNEPAEECGDLLFSVVNAARLAGVEPETALQNATDKFIARFEIVEQTADIQNVDMHTCGIDKLNELWEHAKRTKQK